MLIFPRKCFHYSWVEWKNQHKIDMILILPCGCLHWISMQTFLEKILCWLFFLFFFFTNSKISSIFARIQLGKHSAMNFSSSIIKIVLKRFRTEMFFKFFYSLVHTIHPAIHQEREEWKTFLQNFPFRFAVGHAWIYLATVNFHRNAAERNFYYKKFIFCETEIIWHNKLSTATVKRKRQIKWEVNFIRLVKCAMQNFLSPQNSPKKIEEKGRKTERKSDMARI